MRYLSLTLAFIVGCGSDSIEAQFEERLGDCMSGNGGVEARDIRATVVGDHLTDLSLVYDGQGSASYDAVFESCLLTVSDEFELGG